MSSSRALRFTTHQSENRMSRQRTMGLAASRRRAPRDAALQVTPFDEGWVVGLRQSPMKIKGWRRSRPISACTAEYTDRQRRSGYTRGDESKETRGNSGSRATVALPDLSCRGVLSDQGGVFQASAFQEGNDNCIVHTVPGLKTVSCLFPMA